MTLWAKRFVLIAGLAFTLLNMLAYQHAHAMLNYVSQGVKTLSPESLSSLNKLRILFTGVTVPRPERTPLPEGLLHRGGEVCSVDVADGVNLEGWYVNTGDDSPLVILFHGYSAGKNSLVHEAEACLEFGASVLMIDFRGSGGSSVSYTSLGVHEAEDVAASVQYAHKAYSHPKIILFGRSMGAAAILKALDEEILEVDGIILESVFDRMINTVRNRFRLMRIPPMFPGPECLVFWGGQQQGFNGFHHNPVDYAKRVPQKALLLHGEMDQRAQKEEAEKVYRALPGEKTFISFEKAGHESLFLHDPVKWNQFVRPFVMFGQ